MASEKAYINEHDSIVFLADDDERLSDFTEAGYREIAPQDRVVVQAAEVSTFTWGGEEVAYADVADGSVGMEVGGDHAAVVDYVRKVRDLRKTQERLRARENPEPRVVRKGKNA